MSDDEQHRLGRVQRVCRAVGGLLARGVRRNAIWLIGAQSVALLVTLAATPYELHRMGAERYGIFVVLSVSAGLASLFDFGAAYSVMRLVPWYRARGDAEAAQRVVSAALLLSTVTGVVLAVTVAALAEPLTSLLDISRRLRPDTAEAVRITALFIPVLLVSTVLSGLGRAVDMFALVGALSASQVIALNVAWVAIAGRHRDLVELAVAQLAIGCGVVVVGALAIRRRRGSALRVVWPGHEIIREVGSFGVKTTAGQGSLGMLTSADKPILGAILPVAALPTYSIPFAFAVRITMVSSSVSSAILPPLVAALARGDVDELARLRRRAFASVGLASGLLAANSVFAGQPLLAAWIGHGFASRAWPPFAILGVAFGLAACGLIGMVLLDAAGRPGTSARIMAAGALIGLSSAAAGAAVWHTPLAGSVGISAGLVIICLGGIERARTLAIPESRAATVKTAFSAWLPLAAAAGASRVLCGLVGAPAAVSVAAVVGATAAVAALLAFGSADIRLRRRR